MSKGERKALVGWWDWVRETAAKVGHTIKTGLRGVIDMPSEIEPYLPSRPATQEQIGEAMEQAAYAERFIQEVEVDEARRLARGVPFYERLRNVARMRHWTVQAPEEIVPDLHTQISQRRVLVGPDGAITHIDIAGGYGEAYDADKFLRKAASALDDEFVNRYEGISRSDLIRRFTVATETYVQRHKPLG